MRGRMKYMPKIIIAELEDLKQEQNITRDNIAMIKLADYAKLGREVERNLNKLYQPPKTKSKKSIFKS